MAHTGLNERLYRPIFPKGYPTKRTEKF